ncbi:MAG: hypothetical protein ISN64_03450 [Rickettsia sp.]|nr:hypothetical protein [Rickettsia sp.]
MNISNILNILNNLIILTIDIYLFGLYSYETLTKKKENPFKSEKIISYWEEINQDLSSIWDNFQNFTLKEENSNDLYHVGEAFQSDCECSN